MPGEGLESHREPGRRHDGLLQGQETSASMPVDR
jgi:hypothetical protein